MLTPCLVTLNNYNPPPSDLYSLNNNINNLTKAPFAPSCPPPISRALDLNSPNNANDN